MVYLLYQQPLNWVNLYYYYLWFIEKHREGEETVLVVDSTRHWLELYPLMPTINQPRKLSFCHGSDDNKVQRIIGHVSIM